MPNPDLIPEPFAQSGDKNTIPLERAISDPVYRASWKAGFPPDTRLPKDLGGEAPDGLDFNGLFNALSQAVVFLQKGNAYQFDASLAPYPIGALVRSNDNLTTYQSTVPNNSNNPNSNMTGWRVYNGPGFIVDNLTTNDSTKALSAAQGKKLQDEKFAIANLVNNLTTGGIDKALTAEQGKFLYSMFANSLITNGYQKLPNGLIIQWGVGVSQTGSDDIAKAQSITFPIVFPNSCLHVGVTTNTTAINADVIYQTTAVTKSNFKAFANLLNETNGSTIPHYIAIGY